MEVLAFRHDSDGADIVLGEEQLKAVPRCLMGPASRFHYHFVFSQVCRLPEEYNRRFILNRICRALLLLAIGVIRLSQDDNVCAVNARRGEGAAKRLLTTFCNGSWIGDDSLCDI